MTYSEHHRAEKQRLAQARYRESSDRKDPVKAILRNMLWDTRKRSKPKGLENDLDYEYLESLYTETCNITGDKLLWERGHGKPQDHSPSLDRLDPRKGYTRGNVWIISYRMNRIKNDATPEELELIAERVRAEISKRI